MFLSYDFRPTHVEAVSNNRNFKYKRLFVHLACFLAALESRLCFIGAVHDYLIFSTLSSFFLSSCWAFYMSDFTLMDYP